MPATGKEDVKSTLASKNDEKYRESDDEDYKDEGDGTLYLIILILITACNSQGKVAKSGPARPGGGTHAVLYAEKFTH